ncbi:hypothetical protein RRG08_044691 [Elysia crispata]|uniref:Uncharacterized protein n=1 Tax=Elysia crispata TaxID=231223 RepID=A0AAE0ZYZ9_9GAST|nr:hypothetical protein RRG08_044691 [Elysia crispata]
MKELAQYSINWIRDDLTIDEEKLWLVLCYVGSTGNNTSNRTVENHDHNCKKVGWNRFTATFHFALLDLCAVVDVGQTLEIVIDPAVIELPPLYSSNQLCEMHLAVSTCQFSHRPLTLMPVFSTPDSRAHLSEYSTLAVNSDGIIDALIRVWEA